MRRRVPKLRVCNRLYDEKKKNNYVYATIYAIIGGIDSVYAISP